MSASVKIGRKSGIVNKNGVISGCWGLFDTKTNKIVTDDFCQPYVFQTREQARSHKRIQAKNGFRKYTRDLCPTKLKIEVVALSL